MSQGSSARPACLDLDVKVAGRLSEEEVDKVTALIAEAFKSMEPPLIFRKSCADIFETDNPFRRTLVGGDTSLIPLQFRSTIAAANEGGTIILGTTKNDAGQDELAGALVAFGPGQTLNSTEEQRVAGWNPFIEKVDEYTKKWWYDYVRSRFTCLHLND